MTKDEGIEFIQLQNERQEDAEYMAQLFEAHVDKFGFGESSLNRTIRSLGGSNNASGDKQESDVQAQTRQGLQNAQADPNEAITNAHQRNRNGHKEVANGTSPVRRGMARR